MGLTHGPEDGLVRPTWEDPAARLLSEGIGGPQGAHAGGHRWWTPVRVLLLITAVCFALGMVQKNTCAEKNWNLGDARYTHMCYSDLPYLYTGRGFVERLWPYTDDAEARLRYPQVMEYPVGISYWAYGTAWAAQQLAGAPDLDARRQLDVDSLYGRPDVQDEIRMFVFVNTLGFAAAALLAVWLLAGVDRRRPWDALFVAASPTLALTGIINWDLLAVVCVAGALYAWARGRPMLTGVLIGLGTATKLYPLFLLGGVLVLCLRRRQLGPFAWAFFGAVASWVALNLPAVVHGDGVDASAWRVFWSFNSDRGPDLGSIWLVASQALDRTITPHAVNVGSWGFFGFWCVGVLLVGLAARRTPTLAQLGYLIVVGLLLVNKVYSPQYVLWLLPLAALARPRWRDQIVWQATELFYFAAVWWYLAGELNPPGDGDAGFYWLAIIVRMAGELYLAALIVRDLLRRDPDDAAEDDLEGQPSTTWSNAVVV
ncbi:glycosyltransferase 87 family protein [Nocardioides fonticola]|uniref:Glycosyltransferase 87 family protein n=1 Tax=Nocardioides fonticola TaxID=450363 RepID=A0ABP7XRL5_9ACTN